MDDGFRAGLISLQQLRQQRLFDDQYRRVHEKYPDLEDRRLIYEIIRRMIDRVVTDLIDTSRSNIQAANPKSIEDVRDQPRPLIAFSDGICEEHNELKRFLNANLYRHEKVREMTGKAQRMIEILFERYMSEPGEMSEEFTGRAQIEDKPRVVADYIAGMTDRFAIAEHERLGNL